MSKIKKFIFSVVMLIFCVMLILVIFFPGLYWYQKYADDAKHINIPVQNFMLPEEPLPEDWISYDMYGISFMAPPDLHLNEKNHEKIGKYMTLSTLSVDESAEALSYGKYPVTKDELRQFCQDTGNSYPESNYDSWNLILNLSMHDCNLHSWRSAKAFAHLADLKALQIKLSCFGIFYHHADNYQMFILIDGYYASLASGARVLIFPDNQPYMLGDMRMIGRTSDFVRIISSIKVTELQESDIAD